jgi:hypothetical protein
VPVDGGTCLYLYRDFGPGLLSSDSVALVVGPQEHGKRSLASFKTRPLGQIGEQVQTHYGACSSFELKVTLIGIIQFIPAFTTNKGDASLGCIDILSVPPPHTVASLKSCITKSEGVSAHDLQVLEDDMGGITMKDGDIIALLADTDPGNVEEQPIAILYMETRTPNLATFTKKYRIQHPSGVCL